MNRISLLLLLMCTASFASLAQNEPTKGTFYFQPGVFIFDLGAASTTTSIGGAQLPGENISFTNSTVPGVGVGYHVSPSVSIYTVLALPPTTEANGINALDGQTAAEVTYAPFAITANHHFYFGRFQPFVGAGIAYAAILNIDDKDVTEVEIDNAFGALIRGGFDFMINETWGISAAVNKLFVSTDITGNAPVAPGVQAPAEVAVDLNPLVVSFGVQYRL